MESVIDGLRSVARGTSWQCWTPSDAPLPAVHPLGLACEQGWLRFTGNSEHIARRRGEPRLMQELCLAPGEHVSAQIQRYGRWSDCDRLVWLWRAMSPGADDFLPRGPGNSSNPGPGLFLDVGANIGACTIEMLLRTSARVIAFEPSQANLFHLTRSLRLLAARNPSIADRVVVVPVGLGERREMVHVHAERSNLGNTVLGHAMAQEGSQEPAALPDANGTATVLPLDELFPDGIAHTRLLKLDVQGMECAVMGGGQRALSSRLGAVVSEVTPSMLRQQCCSTQGLLRGLLLGPEWNVRCTQSWHGSSTCMGYADVSGLTARLSSVKVHAFLLGEKAISVKRLSPTKLEAARKRRAKCTAGLRDLRSS